MKSICSSRSRSAIGSQAIRSVEPFFRRPPSSPLRGDAIRRASAQTFVLHLRSKSKPLLDRLPRAAPSLLPRETMCRALLLRESGAASRQYRVGSGPRFQHSQVTNQMYPPRPCVPPSHAIRRSPFPIAKAAMLSPMSRSKNDPLARTWLPSYDERTTGRFY